MTNTEDTLPHARRICLVCQEEYGPEQKRCPDDGTLLVALVADPYLGKTLDGKYEVESLIGSGGTSVVYKAHHIQMHRTVAIKMLKAHLVSDEDSKKRFEQEARAVSCLAHPNVLTIYDVGITNYGEPYIVMEHLEGTSLAELIAREGRLPFKRAIHIFDQSCAALAHAHKKDVLHRDVKPSNIMLIETDDDREFVKIVDFGLAKLRTLTGEFQRLTKTGEVFGSPVYMSPEQCTGKKLDRRTDVYSMGVVMFETLSGRPPFKEKTSIETIRRQIKDQPPRLSEVAVDANLPKGLEVIIAKTLSKNPEDRYQNMEELRFAVEVSVVESERKPGQTLRQTLGQSVPALPPEAPASVSGIMRSVKRSSNVILLVGGAVSVVVIIALLLLITHH